MTLIIYRPIHNSCSFFLNFLSNFCYKKGAQIWAYCKIHDLQEIDPGSVLPKKIFRILSKFHAFGKFHRFFVLIFYQKLSGKLCRIFAKIIIRILFLFPEKNLRLGNFVNLKENFMKLRFFLDITKPAGLNPQKQKTRNDSLNSEQISRFEKGLIRILKKNFRIITG